MTKREAFIKVIDCFFEDLSGENSYTEEEWNNAYKFFEEFKNNKVKNSKEMTENGQKSLTWMQENLESMNNIFTSKEIAESLFTSGRSISGSMRKLVNDGYVEKIGTNPVQYALTEKGMNYKFDN